MKYAISRTRIAVEESEFGLYDTFDEAQRALIKYCEDVVIHTRKLSVQADADLKVAVELTERTV